MKHGINIGALPIPECCDQPWQVERLKQMGFDHVRLGVELGYLFENANPTVLKPDNLKLLDNFIERITNHGKGLAIILFVRFEGEGVQDFDLNNKAFVGNFAKFWPALSSHAMSKGYSPDYVFFETLNEPHLKGADGQEIGTSWPELQHKIVSAIRSGASDYTVIATGAFGSTLYGLLLDAPQNDSNLIYSFHYYNPINFALSATVPYPFDLGSALKAADQIPTDKTARWQNFEEHLGIYWTGARIDSEIEQARNWEINGSVVICDEFGVNEKAQTNDRVRWIGDVRGSLERHHIGWTFWDYKDCDDNNQACLHNWFGLFRKDTPDIGIVKALGRKKPKS
jgi:endoglucanase